VPGVWPHLPLSRVWKGAAREGVSVQLHGMKGSLQKGGAREGEARLDPAEEIIHIFLSGGAEGSVYERTNKC
jgi:hypothetical protein